MSTKVISPALLAIRAKIEADKQKKEAEIADRVIVSGDRTPTPLWVFLRLWAVYQDYGFHGFSTNLQFIWKLKEYLEPIEFPEYTEEELSYTYSYAMFPRDIHNIAMHLRSGSKYVGCDIEEVKKVIFLCLYKEVIPLLFKGKES